MTGRAALRLIVVLLAGLCFGFGLSVSGMVNPGRVLGFLDVASGHWDPSLMVVLAGAVMVTIPGVLLQRRLSHPVLDQRFHLPQNRVIDRRLLVGSAIFGAGWGLAGFCPGPAVASLVIGSGPIVLFVATMLVGMIAHDRLVGRRSA
ncbi:YeeE/YedE family protein [Lichenihabitans psoromatis]|uniref:YeeE/YedE family protein n=1 Tax=Lichenihabitans psoromatis TaxID=2528642 RepID=UPI00103647EF|nr:YeeE/YedE family protein [Lichenihabitans psoromatis]